MRLNRVLALLGLAIAVGIALIWVEGQNLRMRQKLAELHRQREKLIDEQSRLRLAISRMAAPASIMESVKESDDLLITPEITPTDEARSIVQPYLQR